MTSLEDGFRFFKQALSQIGKEPLTDTLGETKLIEESTSCIVIEVIRLILKISNRNIEFDFLSQLANADQ